MLFFRDDTSKLLKVGFLYVGDSSTSYTGNFIKTEKSLTNKYGTNIQIISKKNVPESNCEPVLMELISENRIIVKYGLERLKNKKIYFHHIALLLLLLLYILVDYHSHEVFHTILRLKSIH